MPNKQYEQFSFALGEIDPIYAARADIAVRSRSLQRAYNVRPRVAGPVESRPGTLWLFDAPGDGVLFEAVISNVSYYFVFTDGHVDVYAKASRDLAASLDAPWTADMLADLEFTAFDESVYVFHPLMMPQILSRHLPDGWEVAAFAFDVGVGGTIRQPYYRFADKGVTIRPSSSTQGASVTLTTSAAYFNAQHVGLRLRLQGREVLVTAYTDSTHVTATNIQSLYKTVILPVESTAGFSIGDFVQGKDSAAHGEVVAIPGANSLTILMQVFIDWLYVAADGDTAAVQEQITGPNASTKNTGPAAPATDATVENWTEQAVSPLRGYPATGQVHHDRLWMARLPQVSFALLASAIGAFQDFEPAADDDAAIFEILRAGDSGEVQHIVSAEQLLILTQRRAFYYPETESNPIRPTGFALLEIGPDGAGNSTPIVISEGVVYASNTGGAITVALPTGDVRRSWNTLNVSDFCSHLIIFPKSLAYIDRRIGEGERYVYVVNGNGLVTVLTYTAFDPQSPPGAANWETFGDFRSLAASGSECWALVRRGTGFNRRFAVEVFDYSRMMDGCVDITEDDYQGPATTQTILTPSGPMSADKVYRYAGYKNLTCGLMVGEAYIGTVTLNAQGDFGAPDLEGDIQIGFTFASECVTWAPLDTDDQRSRKRPRRITRTSVRYRGRYMTVAGHTRAAYQNGEDVTLAPPLRDELWQPIIIARWSQEPTVSISKPYPAPWRLSYLSMEVTS